MDKYLCLCWGRNNKWKCYGRKKKQKTQHRVIILPSTAKQFSASGKARRVCAIPCKIFQLMKARWAFLVTTGFSCQDFFFSLFERWWLAAATMASFFERASKQHVWFYGQTLPSQLYATWRSTAAPFFSPFQHQLLNFGGTMIQFGLHKRQYSYSGAETGTWNDNFPFLSMTLAVNGSSSLTWNPFGTYLMRYDGNIMMCGALLFAVVHKTLPYFIAFYGWRTWSWVLWLCKWQSINYPLIKDDALIFGVGAIRYALLAESFGVY